jgi:hypothetical protein
MSATATANATTITTKVDLEDLECSTAKVSVHLDADNAWIRNSLEVFASGDTEEQTVYVNTRRHTYVRLDDAEAITTNTDVFTHRFTREEAEALVAVLTNELGKL